ncbi:MAG TPA: hypothetical protein VEO53_10430, partial [Candidatus Binatia bacterium]|nr:hypothetical protein [Candidatus Binatia bacterium]
MTKDDRLTKTAAPQAILNVKAKWGMKRNVTRPDSKSGGLTPVLVRVRPGAPIFSKAQRQKFRDPAAGVRLEPVRF